MKAPVIAMNAISKRYRLGQVWVPALSDIALSVERGEMVALTGPSGSGKSTLLNIAGLIDSPDSGHYSFAGSPTDGLDEAGSTRLRRSAIGFVFQSFNLVPVFSVAENVEYPLFLDGLLRREARQRVAIARALVKKPRLVIADEPTANLDSETGRKILGLMRALNDVEKTTFIFSTHDPAVLNYAKHVVRIKDGAIAEQ